MTDSNSSTVFVLSSITKVEEDVIFLGQYKVAYLQAIVMNTVQIWVRAAITCV